MTGSGKGQKEGRSVYEGGKENLLQNSSELQSWEGLARPLDHELALQNRCVSLCSQAVGRTSSGLLFCPPVPRASF